MKRGDGVSWQQLGELIDRGRIVRPLPGAVRARALTRAMTAVEGIIPPPAWPRAAVTAPVPGSGLRTALAASVALILGAAGAVAAIGVRIPDLLAPSPPPSALMAPASRVEAPDVAVRALAAREPTSVAKLPRASRPATAQESYAAELGLLQRAQVAYAERDFAGALALVVEHARRFPNGRLAEEREALRVRSLARAGRNEEARRAASTFSARFPRSVLLPRLRQTAGIPD
jgi:hypothetical protein